jgi:hypothetical protein
VRRTIKRTTLIVFLALSMLVVVQAPAFAWVAMADATLQVKKACIDGVELDVGALSPRPLHEDPPTSLSPTADVLIRARIGDPILGQLVLDKPVTLPLHPRAIKLDNGGAPQRIDYYMRFALGWNQQLEVGQTVTLKAVSADFFAREGEGAFTPSFEITTTVKNCRLFK